MIVGLPFFLVTPGETLPLRALEPYVACPLSLLVEPVCPPSPRLVLGVAFSTAL